MVHYQDKDYAWGKRLLSGLQNQDLVVSNVQICAGRVRK